MDKAMFARFTKIVMEATKTRVHLTDVVPNARLRKDLNFSDDDLSRLVYFIKTRFNIEVTEAVLKMYDTVGDIYALLDRCLLLKGPEKVLYSRFVKCLGILNSRDEVPGAKLYDHEYRNDDISRLAERLEEEFDVSVSETELNAVETVGEAFALFKRHLHAAISSELSGEREKKKTKPIRDWKDAIRFNREFARENLPIGSLGQVEKMNLQNSSGGYDTVLKWDFDHSIIAEDSIRRDKLDPMEGFSNHALLEGDEAVIKCLKALNAHPNHASEFEAVLTVHKEPTGTSGDKPLAVLELRRDTQFAYGKSSKELGRATPRPYWVVAQCPLVGFDLPDIVAVNGFDDAAAMIEAQGRVFIWAQPERIPSLLYFNYDDCTYLGPIPARVEG